MRRKNGGVNGVAGGDDTEQDSSQRATRERISVAGGELARGGSGQSGLRASGGDGEQEGRRGGTGRGGGEEGRAIQAQR
jgi:hypothetical protein